MACTPSSWRLTHHFGCKDSDDAEGASSPRLLWTTHDSSIRHRAAATDAVTALEFDDTGDYIAAGMGRMRSLARVHTEFLQRSSAHVGDRRGRVYIFERTSGSCKKQEDEGAPRSPR